MHKKHKKTTVSKQADKSSCAEKESPKRGKNRPADFVPYLCQLIFAAIL